MGEFAVDCGKVDVHRAPGGERAADDDCTSGCNLADTAYCQAEFPGATSVVEIAVRAENKPFLSAGCAEAFPGPGQRQFTGCDVADVGYCRRFWPESVGLVGVDVSPGPKGFTSAGCFESFDVPGQAQFACCAPDVILD